jgi:3,4-dihydroxy 2-butanone 4-phosphate synthase / GTP cyclohydrolase II
MRRSFIVYHIIMPILMTQTDFLVSIRFHFCQCRSLFLKGCSVSKDTKGPVCSFFSANSNNAKVRSPGLRIASSLKKDGGYPASSISMNGEMRLPKSTSVRGQDHSVADTASLMDSMIAPEILSANLARVVDKFSDGDTDTELDLDSPTEGFASIEDAIEDIRQGKVSTF